MNFHRNGGNMLDKRKIKIKALSLVLLTLCSVMYVSSVKGIDQPSTNARGPFKPNVKSLRQRVPVLMVDFRMPTISDSGINFRGLIPEMGNFGQAEQFNLRSKGGIGHLESFFFLPEEHKEEHAIERERHP